MILKSFKDQYDDSLLSKFLWVFRRLMFFLRSWFFDITYYGISLGELEEALEAWKREVLDHLQYVSEVFDCDDFAVYFKSWLQKYIRERYDKLINGVGIALGMVYKDYQLLGGHAWNIVVIEEPGIKSIAFIEPQTAEIITGSKTEDGFEYMLQAVII